LCVALLATTIATHAVFFGEDRYHIVVTPVLAILSSAAFRRSRSARPKGADRNAGRSARPKGVDRNSAAPEPA
jgi:hypothetical protein